MLYFLLDNIGETDCPVFKGMLTFSQIYTGGSIDGARLINTGQADIAINWVKKYKKFNKY